jgi:hypothetical protein
MPKLIDLQGKRFGRWVVVGYKGPNKFGKAQWSCVCDCGTEKVVKAQSLINGDSKSCGCFNKDSLRQRIQLPDGHAALNAFFNQYQNNARNKGRSFDLSKDEFKKLVNSDCAYCGSKPSLFYKKTGANGPALVNGIDRVDNTKGYTVENSIPCCHSCNMMKRDKTTNDFLEHIARIAKHSIKDKT